MAGELHTGRWSRSVRSLNCLGLRNGAHRSQLQEQQVHNIERKSPMFGCKRFRWILHIFNLQFQCNVVFFFVCHPEVFNTYTNMQGYISQTRQNFIMFIIALGQHVSILIESSSGPSKSTDTYLAVFKVSWLYNKNITIHAFYTQFYQEYRSLGSLSAF